LISKKALLVCYSFPPSSGVGGRKWAKLSKYLIRLGWDIQVICKEPSVNETSPWINDIKGVKYNYLPSKYPSILNKNPTNIFQKIWYRLCLLFLKTLTHSNYYDRGVFWEKSLTKLVNEIVEKENISNLIITGAPFSLLYYGAKIKRKNPQINFIADIRDSWLDGHYFGFDGLSKTRKEQEIFRLKTVLKEADTVIVPYETMLNEYSDLLGLNTKIVHHPHAFDEDLLISREMRKNQKKFELVNFGSQYKSQEIQMKSVARAMERMDNIRIDFFTNDHKYKSIFESNALIESKVQFHALIPENGVFEIMHDSNAVLLFVPNHIRDFIATKYMEVIASRVPIVLIGERGLTSEFVVKNDLGIFIPSDSIETEFVRIQELLLALNYNDEFDIEPFTFRRQAKIIEAKLNFS